MKGCEIMTFTEEELKDYPYALEAVQKALMKDYDMQSDNVEEALVCLIIIDALKAQIELTKK